MHASLVRSAGRVVVVGAVLVVLSGCWPTPGAGPDRRSSNPFERTLTPATVSRLTEAFRAPLAEGAGPPVVTVDGLFVRTGRSMAAFEARTGAPRWSVVLPPYENPVDDWVSDPYVVGDGERVVASVTGYELGGFYGSQLVTVAVDTGEVERRQGLRGELWSLRDTRLGTIDPQGPGPDFTSIGVERLDADDVWGGISFDITGPAVATLGRDRLFVVNGGAVRSYDTTTPCPTAPPDHDIPVCVATWSSAGTTPVVIGDDATVYVGSGTGAAGAVVALDEDTGAVRFRAPLGAAVTQPPALAGDVLYVATDDGRLSAVPAGGCGADQCPASWSTGPGSRIRVQPAVAGGVVYVGAADGTLRAFDASGCGAATCAPLWTADAGSPVTGGLAVYGGRLFVGTGGGLVGYRVPGD